MRFLGIDFGSKRVGIAISDETGEFALPHAVFENNKDLLSLLEKLCKEKEIGVIIMGESRNFKGKDNLIMKKARDFTERLKKATDLPTYFEPELFTSAEASRIQGETEMIDASAAALILKSYLNKNKNGIDRGF